MKINQELNNKLNVVCGGKWCIAFSYSTVIGLLDKVNNIAYITTKKWGNTTGRHRNYFISEYCNNAKIENIPQEKIEELADKLVFFTA